MKTTLRCLLLLLILPGLWCDVATTYLSIIQFTNHAFIALLFSFLTSGILVLAFIRFQKYDVIFIIGSILWFAAFSGDLVTGFYGSQKIASIQFPNKTEFILLSLSALYMSGSTISLSYMVFRTNIFRFGASN